MTLQIDEALQDSQLAHLVRPPDKMGKFMRNTILHLNDFASQCKLLQLAADGATPQAMRSQRRGIRVPASRAK